MTEPLTTADRAELRRLHEQATAGMWERIPYGGDWSNRAECLCIGVRRAQTNPMMPCSGWDQIFLGYGVKPADVAATVAAVNALPKLLDALDAADAEIARLKELLKATRGDMDAACDELTRNHLEITRLRAALGNKP